MKIFITGITGFVGSHLVDYLLQNYPEVEIHGLVRWRSPLDNLKHIPVNSYKLHYGDLRDQGSLLRIFKQLQPDKIFHLAAQSYVQTSFIAPVDTLENNIIGTCNLLETIKHLKDLEDYNPRIACISSSEVYGQVKPEEIPIKETNPFRPASPYAVSKVGEDMIAFQYALSYGLDIVRSRMFTHFGAKRGHIFVESAFAKQIAQIEKGLQSPILKVGNLDSIRTFADVRDTVKAYWLMLEKCPGGEVYNIGGETTMTIGQMLDKLIDLSTYIGPIAIEEDPLLLRPSDVTLQIPDCSKFKQITGWQPKIPFQTTLNDLLNYWRSQYE